jgi:RHS repeat-associated protein
MTRQTTTPATYNIERKHSWGVDLSGSMQGAGGVGGLLQTTLCTGTNGSTQSNNYPLFDGNGNVTDYINQAGVQVASYKYDAFGNTHTSSGSLANTFNYRFSTKARDAETGLYYYGYRYYNTTTGKWINRDPIGEKGGLNIYTMVKNDPIRRVDKLGLCELLSQTWLARWFKMGFKINEEDAPGGIPGTASRGKIIVSITVYWRRPKKRICCCNNQIITSYKFQEEETEVDVGFMSYRPTPTGGKPTGPTSIKGGLASLGFKGVSAAYNKIKPDKRYTDPLPEDTPYDPGNTAGDINTAYASATPPEIEISYPCDEEGGM